VLSALCMLGFSKLVQNLAADKASVLLEDLTLKMAWKALT
jgi:hypothetical protein